MKYAAKRTWPEQSKSWEYKEEAATAEDFALAFALTRQLEAGAEFVVIEREGEDADLRFFRVAERSPCRVEPAATPRSAAGGEAAASSEPAVQSAPGSSGPAASGGGGMPDLSPFIATLKYMAKVGALAVAAIVLMGIVISYLRSAWAF